MQIVRADLTTPPDPWGAVVVIDVLRSFSTAAYAFAAGVRVIHPVGSIPEALAVRASLPDALTIGAAPGGWPVPEFDLANSPAALAGFDLAGKELVHCTAGGVHALLAWQSAPWMFAASLVCARATARELRRLAPARVTLVTTGQWTDRDGDEDFACADYIEALLADASTDPAPYVARVRQSDFARRFTGAAGAAHPAADLDCCAAADRFDFALQAVRRGARMVLAPLA
ncbi:MAG: 2-phosphosulfolactate phosphatase [Burkholderiales bacterium]|nr:2-phosphosulfolactate phosphatase [Burkholderiales bacterium]